MSKATKTMNLRGLIFRLTEITMKHLTLFDNDDFINEIILQIFKSSYQEPSFDDQ